MYLADIKSILTQQAGIFTPWAHSDHIARTQIPSRSQVMAQ